MDNKELPKVIGMIRLESPINIIHELQDKIHFIDHSLRNDELTDQERLAIRAERLNYSDQLKIETRKHLKAICDEEDALTEWRAQQILDNPEDYGLI